MNPKTKLSQIQGIGPYLVKKLTKLNISTLEDLVYHFPFRYDDFSTLAKALDAKEGQKVTLRGEIWSVKNVYTRLGRVMTQAIFNDGTTSITLTWFNQSYLIKQISVGDKLQISGKLTKYKNKWTIVSPSWEKIISSALRENQEGKDKLIHTGRLVPVYPETEGLTSRWLRQKIASFLPSLLPKIVDPLPKMVKDNMLPLDKSLQLIHFPNQMAEVEEAKKRLGFDELFFIQLATLKAKADWTKKPQVKTFEVKKNQPKLNKFIQSLPFKLTNAQNRVIDEILTDLELSKPMNRLIQGEVGSGKTVVAAVIAYLTFLNGFKVLYMAPTEILAFQHFDTFKKLLSPLGVEMAIYTGSRKFTKEKNNKEQEQLISTPDIIIGTHALLSNTLQTEKVGLIIVDEQQRFGVEQRSLLRTKAKLPHFLTMTATPIPRTVALTLYGDLDLSIIDELPKERLKVKTHLVPAKKRQDAYKFIENRIKNEGDQAYIITPLIEESETLASVKAATVEFKRLQTSVFPSLKLGLLHGKLNSKEKERVLNDFKEGKLDILVSTTVVEVGVDVKNATILLLESAERFGLSQIHQLRGRVGRGSKQSYCLLFSEDPNSTSRLKNLEKIDNGLKLAELDLKIRGAGQIFGTLQAGRIELKMASFSDLPLIEKSRGAASQILTKSPTLAKFPLLKERLQTLSGKDIMPD